VADESDENSEDDGPIATQPCVGDPPTKNGDDIGDEGEGGCLFRCSCQQFVKGLYAIN
jgi:hypothetical protein